MTEAFQEVLQICREVYRQSRMVSQKRCSLFTESHEDLRQMMGTLQKISGKISVLSKTLSMGLRRTEYQSMAMVIFASIVLAVENVGKFVELDGMSPATQLSPSSGMRRTLASTAVSTLTIWPLRGMLTIVDVNIKPVKRALLKKHEI